MIASFEMLMDAAVHYGGLMLIHGTILALITWLLSVTALRNTRPAFRAALWVIVLTRFLVPPILPGEMALSSWVSKAADSITINQSYPAEFPLEPKSKERSPVERLDHSRISSRNSTGALIFGVYLAFVFLLGTRSLWMLMRTRRQIRALPVVNNELQKEVRALSRTIGLSRAPDVRWGENDLTPFVFGFWRPVMVMPRCLIIHLEPLELRALILHELAHVRRKDVLSRLLQSLARTVFFFFPPVLWVCRQIEHFTEMACDEWAVAISGVNPRDYAETLIKVVREVNRVPQPQMGLALLRNARLLEKRLRAVLSVESSAMPRLSLSLRVMLLGWLLFGLLGGTQASQSEVSAKKLKESLSSSGQEVVEPQKEESEKLRRVERPQRSEKAREKAAVEKNLQASEQVRRQVQSKTAGDANSLGSASKERSQRPAENSLSPFERGYLLGKQFAEESLARSKEDPSSPSETSARNRDYEAKRAIELRAQERSRRPVQ